MPRARLAPLAQPLTAAPGSGDLVRRCREGGSREDRVCLRPSHTDQSEVERLGPDSLRALTQPCSEQERADCHEAEAVPRQVCSPAWVPVTGDQTPVS